MHAATIPAAGTNDMSQQVTLKDVYEEVGKLRKELSDKYVTKDAFTPVRNIAYGLVSAILLSFIGAVITLVIRTQ